ELLQDLNLSHARGQHFENIFDTNPHPADTGLSPALVRVHGDPVAIVLAHKFTVVWCAAFCNGETRVKPSESGKAQPVEDAAGSGIEGEGDLVGDGGVGDIEPIGAETHRNRIGLSLQTPARVVGGPGKGEKAP